MPTMPTPLGFHGKKLLQALETEGLLPPGARVTSAMLEVSVNGAVLLTYETVVSGDDLLKLRRALDKLWPIGGDDDHPAEG